MNPMAINRTAGRAGTAAKKRGMRMAPHASCSWPVGLVDQKRWRTPTATLLPVLRLVMRSFMTMA